MEISTKKSRDLFFCYKRHPFYYEYSSCIFCYLKNEKVIKYASASSKQQKVVIGVSKLICFISKISVLGYFCIAEHAYTNLPLEEQENMLNICYNELYEKYYGTGNFVFFILLFLCLLSPIFCLIPVLLVLAIIL